ncbi:xylose isomerase [Rhodothermaceae bacterium RA]|nr:xylose isomerase [Rhodothermaceae bacterium RA]
MRIAADRHLTYCTNIHPGETWAEVQRTLRHHLPPLKAALAPEAPFGVGLRLSRRAVDDLRQEAALVAFRDWLAAHDLYVFTLNGFPYGGFHQQVVKDRVYAPDWRTEERVDYTVRLAEVLAALLPEGLEGGISTSPISYKPWLAEAERRAVRRIGARHVARVVAALVRLERDTGAFIHLDIEPEPDCLIENAAEWIGFYEDDLLHEGRAELAGVLGETPAAAEAALRRHVQLCYDTCHFAVEFETPAEVWAALDAAGIGVGKVQISSALDVPIPPRSADRAGVHRALEPFAESTYLHQVVARHRDGRLTRYPDLLEALPRLAGTDAEAWRIHYHVPLFADRYGPLSSTRPDVEATFDVLGQTGACRHLEIETYTWDVLPEALKIDLGASIRREYDWVLEALDARGLGRRPHPQGSSPRTREQP